MSETTTSSGKMRSGSLIGPSNLAQKQRPRPLRCRRSKSIRMLSHLPLDLFSSLTRRLDQSYGGYITDITRTWPVSGKFSSAQRDLYSAILAVQRSCVSLCRADANVSLDKIHEIAETGLREQLGQLGFDMSGNVRHSASFILSIWAFGIYTTFRRWKFSSLTMWGTTSGSTCTTRRATRGRGASSGGSASPSSRKLQSTLWPSCFAPASLIVPGLLTLVMDSGIYVPADDGRWPAAFRGMGIRTEDSVCVQDEGPLVLTTEAVKEVC